MKLITERRDENHRWNFQFLQRRFSKVFRSFPVLLKYFLNYLDVSNSCFALSNELPSSRRNWNEVLEVVFPLHRFSAICYFFITQSNLATGINIEGSRKRLFNSTEKQWKLLVRQYKRKLPILNLLDEKSFFDSDNEEEKNSPAILLHTKYTIKVERIRIDGNNEFMAEKTFANQIKLAVVSVEREREGESEAIYRNVVQVANNKTKRQKNVIAKATGGIIEVGHDSRSDSEDLNLKHLVNNFDVDQQNYFFRFCFQRSKASYAVPDILEKRTHGKRRQFVYTSDFLQYNTTSSARSIRNGRFRFFEYVIERRMTTTAEEIYEAINSVLRNQGKVAARLNQLFSIWFQTFWVHFSQTDHLWWFYAYFNSFQMCTTSNKK